MGLDLTLLPNRYYQVEGILDGYNQLRFFRDLDLFERIHELQSQPLKPTQFVYLYSSEGVEKTQTDPYGDVLHWVKAEKFLKISTDKFGESNTIVDRVLWNDAIITFLQNLPPDMPVILYWH